MPVRIRSLVGLVVVVTLIFITITAFLPAPTPDSAIARGLRSSRQYFTSESLLDANREKVLSNGDKQTQDVDDSLSVIPPSINRSPINPSAENLINTPPQITAIPAPIVASPGSVPVLHQPILPTDDIRLLIGVMSPFWSSARRQIIRNAYSRFPKGLPVDVVFVEGELNAENERNQEKVLGMQRTAVSWENHTFHDIMHLDCTENLEYGKTYEYLKKVGLEFGHKYTHVMKTDDDSFVNIPALVEVLRANKGQEHFYWGTTWREPDRQHLEMWGSGYILGMDLVKWISTSDIPPRNTWGYEDLQVAIWLIDGHLDDNFVVNRTAFAGYPWPELGDAQYKQENDVRPFDRWTLVTHPLKEDFMWVETAEYYLGLEW